MKNILYIVNLLICILSFQVQVLGQNLPQNCTGGKVRYRVSGLPQSVYNWEVQGGTIIANNNDSVDIQWDPTGTMGVIKVTEHSVTNCTGSPVYAYVIVNSPKSLSLNKVNPICFGQKTLIGPKNTFTSYMWNTGEITRDIEVSQEGWYRLRVVDENGCSSDDSVYLTVNPLPKVFLGNDTMVCEVDHELKAGEGSFYNWSNNLQTSTIIVKDEKKNQTFWVEVTNEYGCVGSDTINILACKGRLLEGVPNTFTPNKDGFNDTWNIPGLGDFPKASIQVYDRWGRQVLKSSGMPQGGWDGTSRGKPLPMDSYYYIIDLGDGSEPIPGTVTIVR